MPNVTANLEVIDQNLSVVVYLSSSSTVLLLLPSTRIRIITTGHDLAFAALPVGVDMLHSGSCCRRSPALHVSEVTGSLPYSLQPAPASSGELCSSLC